MLMRPWAPFLASADVLPTALSAKVAITSAREVPDYFHVIGVIQDSQPKKVPQCDASEVNTRPGGKFEGYTDFYIFFITLLPVSLQLSWQVCCGDNTAIQLQYKF